MNGDVHGTNGEPSTEHWKVALGWLDSNVKVALKAPVGSAGPERMVVSGSPRIVQVWDGRGRVDVRDLGQVDRADLERVLALGQAEQLVHRFAALERPAVQRALELLDRLVAGEAEDHVRAGVAGRRAGHDERVRRRGVDRRR